MTSLDERFALADARLADIESQLAWFMPPLSSPEAVARKAALLATIRSGWDASARDYFARQENAARQEYADLMAAETRTASGQYDYDPDPPF